jgi:hypothetical protein
MAEVRREEVAVSWVRVVSGPAVSTKFPFAVHWVADTRTLAWAAEEIRALLQTGMRVTGMASAMPLRVLSAEWERVMTRLGLEAGVASTACAISNIRKTMPKSHYTAPKAKL